MSFHRFCTVAALISIGFSALMTVTSITTRETPYASGVIGELLLYLVLPGIAGWKYKLSYGLFVGVSLGLLDGLIVLVEDLTVGPMLPDFAGFSVGSWLFASLGVLGLSTALGLIGSSFGALLRKLTAA